MQNLDISYDRLIKFENDVSAVKELNLSESDTRSKILDRILIDILGWTEYDIEREGFVRKGYFDYEIRTASFRFVVEAKKHFHQFSLPQKGNEIKMKTIYDSNKQEIDQLRGYLFERGLSYGVLTNGTQFLVGRFCDFNGNDWKEEKCIYFKDFQDIKNNFLKFYDLLSRESVCTYGRIKIVKEHLEFKTILRDLNLKYKDAELIRNQLSNQLIPIINSVFEELYNTDSLDSKRILERCYVLNDDVKKYNSELGHLFADSPPTFDNRIVSVQNTRNTHAQIKSQLFDSNNYLPDPIILIGSSGAGKTTFIKYFTEIILLEKEKKNRPIIYLDFRSFTSQTIRDTRYIYKMIIEQIEEKYPDLQINKINILKTIYKRDIEKKSEGIWAHLINKPNELDQAISDFIQLCIADSVYHLQKVSNYLIFQCQKRLCIVFDNADQLDDDDQKEIFLLGNSINRSIKSIVMISLREGYFYKWKNKPPFNAYQSIVYHITAPPYKEVLKKRVEYVVNNFKFENVKLQLNNKSVEFVDGSLKKLFSNLYDTLFSGKNHEVLDFLEETSYPDIRQGLEKFKSFLLSGHSKISDYMSLEYGTGSGIPIWEFVKSIALASKYYYDSSKSMVSNLFLPSANNRNHFTKIRLLTYLLNRITPSNKKTEFIPCSEICAEFVKAGYTIDVIIEELQELFVQRMVSTSELSEDIEEVVEINKESKLSLTPIGLYYIRTLLYKFYYIDLVLQDTPIYDNDYFQLLESSFPHADEFGNRELGLRIKTTRNFIEYLAKQEELDFSEKWGENLDSALTKKVVDSIKDKLKIEYTRLERALNNR